MKKYKIIYADPPWTYNDKFTKGGAHRHYDVLSLKDIKELPVREVADDNCFLFLWVTFPLLQEGLDVMTSWGFKYKTVAFNWVKLTKKGKLAWGMGNYTRGNAEICIVGVKGKPKVLVHNINNIVMAQKGKHSEKPCEVRDKIVLLCGDVPRLEMFARTQTQGWDVFGNEVEESIELRTSTNSDALVE